jgi:hypothetical protein
MFLNRERTVVVFVSPDRLGNGRTASASRTDKINAGSTSKSMQRVLFFARVFLLIAFAGIPSLYLGFLTLLALWMGVVQFFLLSWWRAPDLQFLVLGSAGAAGLCGLWMLILISTERLRASAHLRVCVTMATSAGMVLALLFLLGKSVYGWNFGNHPNIRALYLLGAPFLLALVLLYHIWRPLKMIG